MPSSFRISCYSIVFKNSRIVRYLLQIVLILLHSLKMKLFLALLGTFLLASATPVISAAAPRHGSYESSPFGQEMKVQRDLDRRSCMNLMSH